MGLNTYYVAPQASSVEGQSLAERSTQSPVTRAVACATATHRSSVGTGLGQGRRGGSWYGSENERCCG